MLLLTVPAYAAEKPLSISDLGMPQQETQNNPKLQQDLQTRSTMLKWHQWLGIAALAPMAGNYIIGTGSPLDASTRNLHVTLGLSTAVLYFTSAAFAIFAPKPDGIKDTGSTKCIKDTGSTKWHRWLSFIHFPLMILVPILGNMARQQAENGEKLSGAASYHGIASSALLATYAASITVMVFNF